MADDASSHFESPPPVIDAARLICYAQTEQGIDFTGRICLLVDGVRVGRVPRLAICKNLCDPGDFLLLFCTAAWESVGAIGANSLESLLIKAEVGYSGISALWHYPNISEQEVEEFVSREYKVDPRSKWWDIPGFKGESEA